MSFRYAGKLMSARSTRYLARLARTQSAELFDVRREDVLVEFLAVFDREEHGVELADRPEVVCRQRGGGNALCWACLCGHRGRRGRRRQRRLMAIASTATAATRYATTCSTRGVCGVLPCPPSDYVISVRSKTKRIDTSRSESVINSRPWRAKISSISNTKRLPHPARTIAPFVASQESPKELRPSISIRTRNKFPSSGRQDKGTDAPPSATKLH